MQPLVIQFTINLHKTYVKHFNCYVIISEIIVHFTLIINQQMHYIKFHVKTFKISPKCFDPKIILRELRCSLLKSF